MTEREVTASKRENVSELLAENIRQTSYEDLSPGTVAATKREILDTLGLILVGSMAAGCPSLVSLAKDEGGKAQSSILPAGIKVPAANAAMVNSALAHAWEFDDTDDRTGNHVGAIAVPAALATAESLGSVTGKEFITAVALGADLGCRLLLAAKNSFAGPTTAATAPFAATATVAKILGLKTEEISHALGLAFAQVAFGPSHLTGPSLTKRLKAGLGSRAGVLAALLAAKGIKATTEDTFQGPRGFYQTFYKEEGDLQRLCSELGKKFEVVNLSTKPYPCCRSVHGPIDATLSLIREHDVKPQEVEEVAVHLGDSNYRQQGGSDPAAQAIKRQPRFVIEAQFSVFWTVAAALTKGRVFADSFTEEGLKDTEIRTMAQKVRVVANSQLSCLPVTLTPAIVEIKMKHGTVHSRQVELAWGNPSLAWSWEDTENKFWECAHYGAQTLFSPKLKEVVNLVRNLEKAGDVSVLASLLRE